MDFRAESYPKKIDGDLTKDDILKMNPELKLFPEIKKLIKELDGDMEKVNQTLWAFLHVADPRTFYSKILASNQIRDLLEKEYLGDWWEDDNWDKFKYIDTFILKKLLINDDVVYYVMFKRSMEAEMLSGDIKPAKIKQNRDVLEELKQAAFSVIKEAKEYYQIQGQRQPGLGARTPKS